MARRYGVNFASAFGTGSAGVLAASSQPFVLGGTVEAGALVCQYESGAVLRANPLLPWGVLNNNTAGMAQSFTGALTAINTTLCTVGHPKQLSNGNVVIPVQQSGGSGFLIRTPIGQQIRNWTSATTDVTATQPPAVVPLSGGGFFYVWNTSSAVKLRLFDNWGNSQGSAVTVASNFATTNNDTFRVQAQLANGNVVVVWSTSSAIMGQIYNTSAATVGSSFTIASVQGDTLALCPCANGDFLVGFAAASGTLFNLYRLSSSGTAVWGPITPSAATSRYTITNAVENQLPSSNRLVELAATGYIAWTLPDVAGAPAVYVLNSSGTLQSTVTTTGLSQTSNCPGTIALTPEGFAFIFGATSLTTNPYIYFYDSYGDPLVQNQIRLVASPQAAGNANTTFYAVWAGTGLAIVGFVAGVYVYLGLSDVFGNLLPYQGYVAQAGVPASPAYSYQQNITVNQNGQPLFEGNTLANGGNGYAYNTVVVGGTAGTPASVPTFGINSTDSVGSPVPVCGPDGLLCITYSDRSNNNVYIKTYTCCRSSVLGIAVSGGSVGTTVTVNGAGGTKLPATQIFGSPTTFDQRGAVIWGCRGVVGGIPGVGSFANLAGWQ